MVSGQDVLGKEGWVFLSKSLEKFVKVEEKFVKVGHYLAKAEYLLKKIWQNSLFFGFFVKKSGGFRKKNSGGRMFLNFKRGKGPKAQSVEKKTRF